jgi:hypothetical protein
VDRGAGYHVVLHLAHERGDAFAVQLDRDEHVLAGVMAHHGLEFMCVELHQRRAALDSVHCGGNGSRAAHTACRCGTLFRALFGLQFDLFIRHILVFFLSRNAHQQRPRRPSPNAVQRSPGDRIGRASRAPRFVFSGFIRRAPPLNV